MNEMNQHILHASNWGEWKCNNLPHCVAPQSVGKARWRGELANHPPRARLFSAQSHIVVHVLEMISLENAAAQRQALRFTMKKLANK